MYLCFSFTRGYCIPVFFFSLKKWSQGHNLVPSSDFCFFKNANASENKIVKGTFNKNEQVVIDTGTNDIHILILWHASTAATNTVTHLL